MSRHRNQSQSGQHHIPPWGHRMFIWLTLAGALVVAVWIAVRVWNWLSRLFS
jgi:hypothetical protein